MGREVVSPDFLFRLFRLIYVRLSFLHPDPDPDGSKDAASELMRERRHRGHCVCRAVRFTLEAPDVLVASLSPSAGVPRASGGQYPQVAVPTAKVLLTRKDPCLHMFVNSRGGGRK